MSIFRTVLGTPMRREVTFYSVVRTLTPVVLPLSFFVGVRKGKSVILKACHFEQFASCGKKICAGLRELAEKS
jgi:hypothetical protein